MMRTAALCAVLLVIASSFAGAQVIKFDTLGFESSAGYTPGALAGQQGWSVEVYGGGGAEIVDGTSSPVVGGQALMLTAPDYTDDPDNPGEVINDGVTAVHLTTDQSIKWAKVSFDVWRDPGTVEIQGETYKKSAMNLLYWWTKDATANYGMQMDGDNMTYPFGSALNAGSAPTVTGSYANVTLLYDFTNRVRSSWYNGVQIDNNIALGEPGEMKSLSDIQLYYERPVWGEAGNYGCAAYVDNLYVEYELNSVPEPGPIVALATGLMGLIGLRRRRS